MYKPPQADPTTALKELHWTLCKLETIYPEAAFIVAVDLKKANFITSLPKFYQYIYCSFAQAINSITATLTSVMHTRPSLALPSANLTTTPSCSYRLIDRNSNRMYLWLKPFNAGLTNRNPRFKIVLADWDMFRSATENNIDLYADSVSEFIRKCIGDVVHTMPIKILP